MIAAGLFHLRDRAHCPRDARRTPELTGDNQQHALGQSPFVQIADEGRDAAVEVRKPTMFGELIIMIVYLPILTLEGVEGKLFRPMAMTVIMALAGSMVMSLTLMPVS